jgi:hypothetical protein
LPGFPFRSSAEGAMGAGLLNTCCGRSRIEHIGNSSGPSLLQTRLPGLSSEGRAPSLSLIHETCALSFN